MSRHTFWTVHPTGYAGPGGEPAVGSKSVSTLAVYEPEELLPKTPSAACWDTSLGDDSVGLWGRRDVQSPVLPGDYGSGLMELITDAEIRALLNEEKPLPPDYRERLRTKTKPGHKESEIEVLGSNASRFWLIIRQSLFQSLDFSVIVAFQPPGSYGRFILRRYNGKSHEHGNGLEGEPPFYDFHIHVATERYQRAGWPHEEHFAERSVRYGSVEEALDCALQDCNFRVK